VHRYFYVPVAYILIQRAQKRHDLIERPLKMTNFVQYLLGRLYTKICERKLKKIREFLSHTDWVYKQSRLYVLITITQGLLG